MFDDKKTPFSRESGIQDSDVSAERGFCIS